MSKLKIIPIFFLIIILCACNKATVKPISRSLTFTAHVFYFNKEYMFDVNIDNDGNMLLTVKEPEMLSGAKVVLAGEESYTEFKDIKYPVDITRAGGAPYFLLGVMKDIKDEKAEKKGDEYIITGGFADENYEISYAATGIPIKLIAKNLTVEFMNAQIIK